MAGRLLFKKQAGSWIEEAVLEPKEGIRFDARVAIDGDTIAVADYQDNEAYVFRLTDGIWSQEATLTAGVPVPGHSFGIGVALDGDRIVVGSRYEAPDSIGAAYIYERLGGSWALVQRIVPSNGQQGDRFGWYVAIDGDTVAVGAPYADAAGTDSGCAYVFRRTSGVWIEESILVGSQTSSFDRFAQVSLAKGRLVVGARYADTADPDTGEAYVFTHDGSAWTELWRLTAPDAEAGDTFGVIFDMAGDSIIVGSPLDDDLGTDSGSAYILDLEPPLDFPAVVRGGWLAALGHRLRAVAGLPR